MISAVLLGRRQVRWFIGYGVLIGIGFLASPAVKSKGIGPFGSAMPVTVIVAHIVYGWDLGSLYRRWTRSARVEIDHAAEPPRIPARHHRDEPGQRGRPGHGLP